MGYVYILTNYNKTVLYTGVTNNLQRRLYEHRMGINDSFTKRYHVYYLVYYETISNIKDAIHREKSIKGFSRSKKEALINSINPEWEDLSKESLLFFPQHSSRFFAALRMTSYGLPHHGYRSFTSAYDDALPWVPLYRQAWEQLKSRLCLSG